MALHCPAVMIVVALSDGAQAPEVEAPVADLLSGENIAAVYSTSGQVATQAAARLARLLGLAPPTAVVAGPAASQAIADAHRGETVLVLDVAPARGPGGRWVRTAGQSATGSARPQDLIGTGGSTPGPIVDVVRVEAGDDGTRVLPPRRP